MCRRFNSVHLHPVQRNGVMSLQESMISHWREEEFDTGVVEYTLLIFNGLVAQYVERWSEVPEVDDSPRLNPQTAYLAQLVRAHPWYG